VKKSTRDDRSHADLKFGLKVGVIAIPHTFNGRLEFNAHVHVMVTAGGLETSGDWMPSVYYERRVVRNLLIEAQ
jgi:hypothetical protein